MRTVQATRRILLLGTLGSAYTLASTRAPAQVNPDVVIEQISPSLASPARAPLSPPASHVTAPIVPGQRTDARPSPYTPPQLGPRSVDTRVAAVPSGAVDACSRAQRRAVALPNGIDCRNSLESTAAAAPSPRRPTPEEALLGVAPTGTAPTMAAGRSTSLPDANTVARRLGSGDVQGAPVAEAVGAFVQQAPPATTPRE